MKTLLLILALAVPAQAAYLKVEETKATLGQPAAIVVNLVPDGDRVSTLQFDIDIKGADLVDVKQGPSATDAGKTLMFSADRERVRVIVFALNTTEMREGELATINVTPTAPGFAELSFYNMTAGDPDGNAIKLWADPFAFAVADDSGRLREIDINDLIAFRVRGGNQFYSSISHTWAVVEKLLASGYSIALSQTGGVHSCAVSFGGAVVATGTGGEPAAAISEAYLAMPAPPRTSALSSESLEVHP